MYKYFKPYLRFVNKHPHMSFRLRNVLPIFGLVAIVVVFIPTLLTSVPSLVPCRGSDMGLCSLLNANMVNGVGGPGNVAKGSSSGAEEGGGVVTPGQFQPKEKRINGTVRRDMFPNNFVWGTATAAYQVEGAYKEGGRGLSIWDTFSHKPGKTANGDTGDIACDQYHRYQEDIELMADMGVDAYRFSISWSRIFPTGEGEINPEGVGYYNRLINALLDKGIQPYVTLYHWDLPQALHDKFGGWLDPQIVPYFKNYADACFAAFGDRVKHWITFNEPLTFSFVGYGLGVHAPGRCTDRSRCEEGNSATESYIVVHQILNSHAAAAKLYMSKYQSTQKGFIGITVDSEWAEPASGKPADMAAAQRHLEFSIGWILDPIFKGDYPAVMRKNVGDRLQTFTKEELKVLKNSVDFVGLNHYTTRWVSDGIPPSDLTQANIFSDQWIVCSATMGENDIGLRAASEWLYVVPWGLGKLVTWLSERYQPQAIFITENGMDEFNNGSLPLKEALADSMRVQFYNDYLLSVAGAIEKGAKVQGYFAWSLLDNFEWSVGYAHRFGLHYVDHNDNLKRYPKDSAKWWKKFLTK